MYKFLIVEDEPLELKALAKMVEGCSERAGRILLAKDSDEALELARAENPDIMLLDINIPGITGLEVLETLREEGYSGNVVVITAYGHFEFAQNALRANAVDFLLKPVDPQELNACLNKVFSRIEASLAEQKHTSLLQQRIETINTYLQPLLLHRLIRSENVESALRALFNWPQDGKLQAYMLRLKFSEKLTEDEQRSFYFDFCSSLQPYFSIIAATEAHEMTFALQALRRETPARLELILYCTVTRILQAIRSQGCSCLLISSKLYTSYAEFARFGSETDAPFPRNPPLRLTALRKELRPSVRKQKAKVFTCLKSGAPKKAISALNDLLSDSQKVDLGLFCLFSTLIDIDPDTNIAAALDHVLHSAKGEACAVSDWILQNYHWIQSADHDMAFSFVIDSALILIQTEYNNATLSQAEIAERFGLSHAHFSRLFKKEVGETFISCLTRTRLTHAKVLLDEGKSFSKVAECCGYQSKKYFLDAFRLHYGISATQYLEKEIVE